MTDAYPTSIRLPPELRDALQRRADAEDRSLNNYILRVLKVHVESTKEPGGGKGDKSRK